jgi:hypothetical protein
MFHDKLLCMEASRDRAAASFDALRNLLLEEACQIFGEDESARTLQFRRLKTRARKVP